ncbi:MAG: glycosyltransferase, partial [Candidatus Hydrothermarchaeales archaeon]
MKTLRIAILSWEAMYSVRSGGQAPAVTGLAEALAKKGHDVHFFTRTGEGQTADEDIEGVHYHRCVFDPGGNIVEYCHNMSNAMLQRVYDVEEEGGFDLVHGHDWHVVDALHELKGSRPLLLTFHSTEFG